MSFKYKVLNLYSQDESSHFRIEPQSGKVTIQYDYGESVVEIPSLTVSDVNVYNKMSENTLAVVNEETRAQQSESEISSNLTTESDRAIGRENAIEVSLNDEKNRLGIQEGLEAQALANEVLARENLEIALTTAINNESNTRYSADTAHTQQIADEKARAEGIESALRTDLEWYMQDLDTRLDNQIAKEQNYEVANNARCDTIEASATALEAKHDTEMAQEVADRKTAVAGVQSQIDHLLDASPAHLDQLSEIVSKFSVDGSDYASRLNDLEAIVSALVEQLTE